MVRLESDLPLPVALESLTIRPLYAELIEVLEHCDFKSLLVEVRAEAKAAPVVKENLGEVQGDLFPVLDLLSSPRAKRRTRIGWQFHRTNGVTGDFIPHDIPRSQKATGTIPEPR